MTAAQALERGVSHLNLSRLADAGALVRLAYGVYRDAGAPVDRLEALRAAWLATDPKLIAYKRLSAWPVSAVVSGETAAMVHGIGDFRTEDGVHDAAT